MLPYDSYKEITRFISVVPEVFADSEIIGVYLGNEICASIIHNADKLNRIRFYENLSVMDDSVKEKFISLYKDWESQIPNLNVLIKDGRNFDTNATFIYHDMDMSQLEFFNCYGSKLKGKLLANCGWGSNFITTLHFTHMTLRGFIFPVAMYRDILFYVLDVTSYYELFNLFRERLELANINHNIQHYDDNLAIIKIIEAPTYEDLTKDI